MDDAIIDYIKESKSREDSRSKEQTARNLPDFNYGQEIARTLSGFTPQRKAIAKFHI